VMRNLNGGSDSSWGDLSLVPDNELLAVKVRWTFRR